MNNIDEFNIAVAEIFGKCYREFPLRVNISIMDVGIAIKEAFGDDPDGNYNLAEKEYKIAEEATLWLIEAGYLWCKNPERAISFEGTTLSPKGLEVLNAIPEGLKTDKTLGEMFSKGLKVLGKDAVSTAVKFGLTQGLKLAIGT